MMNQIQGQPISFTDPSCGNYCLPLANNTLCNEAVLNPTFADNPITEWTLTTGTQVLERVFATTGGGLMQLDQSITLAAGNYVAFYKFNSSVDFTVDLTITNAVSAVELFDTSAGDASGGSYEFTATGGSSRTVTLAFDEVLSGNFIYTTYFYICNTDVFIPETDFSFQLPMFSSGSNLLSGTTVSFDNTQDIFVGNDTAQPLSQTFGGAGVTSYMMDTAHNSTVAGEDGFYFFKYALGDVSISYGQNANPGDSQNIFLEYRVDANQELINFNVNTTSGGRKTTSSWTMTSGQDVDAYLRAYYEQDSAGTWRLDWDITDLTTDMTKMWQEDTFTATDDTKYRLQFKTTNATAATVKVYDSASVLIFQADSDGLVFDKIFDTGTLPAGKTVTVRYELDQFVDYSASAYYTDVLTEVSLVKQCQYGVALETLAEATISQLTEIQDTTVETQGSSYNRNIEYTLDVNSVGITGCYQLRATNDCDATAPEYISNCVEVCGVNCSAGLVQIAWNPSNIKCVGSDILDYENYTGNPWLWVKAELQDLDIEREAETYVRSDSYVNIPWSRSRNFYTLQIWPLPRFMRIALASAFQDTFTIDGEEFQVIDEDAISVVFNARYENPVRITVHKVGEFITSRNI